MDVLTKEQRSKNMSHIRSHDTKPEIILRKALWKLGIRYRKNYKDLPGSPDIAITRCHVAIFVDGDFWHAKGHQNNPGEQVATRKDFWTSKLRRNVERDKEINEILTQKGWLVLRFWDSDIKKHLNGCIETILSYVPIKNKYNVKK